MIVSEIDFRFGDLRDRNFYRHELRGADFTSARVDDSHFVDSNLQNLDAEGISARKCVFKHNCMARSDFSRGNFAYTVFIGCNLSECDFRDANLEGASFYDCDVSNAHFGGANLIFSKMIRPNHLDQANFEDSDLSFSSIPFGD